MAVLSSPVWMFIQKLHTHVATFWKIQNTNQYLRLFSFSHIDLFTGPLLPSTRLNTSLLADNLVHISHRLGLCLNNTFSDDLPWLSMILLVFPLYSVDCTHLESLFKPSLLCSLGGWQNQIHPLGSQILSSGHREASAEYWTVRGERFLGVNTTSNYPPSVQS